MKIKYVTADIFEEFEKNRGPMEVRTMIHCCNNLGVMGSGFVVPLLKNYPHAGDTYRELCAEFEDDKKDLLGRFDSCTLGRGLELCNMIGQDGVGPGSTGGEPDTSGRPPIRYSAIMECCFGISFALKSSVNKIKPALDAALEGGHLTPEGKLALTNNPTLASVHCPLFGSGLAGGNWDFIEQILIEAFIDNGIPVTVYQMPGQELRPSENI